MKRNHRIVTTGAFVCAALFCAPRTWSFQPSGDQSLRAGEISPPTLPGSNEARISQPREKRTFRMMGAPALGGKALGETILDRLKKGDFKDLGLRPDVTMRLDYVQGTPRVGGGAETFYVRLVQVANGLDVVGGELVFTIQFMGGTAKIVSTTGQVYPELETFRENSLGRSAAEGVAFGGALGAGSQDNRVYKGARVRWLGGKWRALEEFLDSATGQRVVVDGSGMRVSWDERRFARSVFGNAGARLVKFNPSATGANLDQLPLAGLKVEIASGPTTFTDSLGGFTLENVPDSATEIFFRLSGQWAKVNNASGANETVGLPLVSAPGPISALFNQSGNQEFVTAQTNGYYHTHLVHQWLIGRGVNPVGIDVSFPVNVNLMGSCNAYYNGTSINFYQSSPSGTPCINFAYDTIIYHEYGHFVDDMIGGIPPTHVGYGLSEGWGDVLSAFVTGQPLLAEGYNGSPGSFIRRADNNYLYNPNDFDEHTLGQAWVGFAWDLRQSLIASEGNSTGVSLAEQLIIPVLWANSPDIPSAVNEVFLRDDNDGDLSNGTPHFNQIVQAALNHGLGSKFDATPPQVSITSPAPGSALKGTVLISGQASDNDAVSRVDILVDGAVLGQAEGTTQWVFSLDTTMYLNGPHTVQAKAIDRSNNSATAQVALSFSNVVVPLAGFDDALKVPRCAASGIGCDSGELLVGRDTLKNGPELHQPNTLQGSCPDGTMGVFHQDESLDRLRVTSLDGTALQSGQLARISATVWAFSPPLNFLDLYTADDAQNPQWQFLTTLQPVSYGNQVLTADLTLSSGSHQAVRAQFRYGAGDASNPCKIGSFTDHDDLAFAVLPAQIGMAAPTNLRTQNVDGDVRLLWDNANPSQVISHLLDVSTSAVFESFLPGYDGKQLGPVSQTLISGLDLQPLATYYARVRAQGATSLSPYSNPLRFVFQGLPDFVATVLKPTSSILFPGENFGFSITVKNAGDSPGGCSVQIHTQAQPYPTLTYGTGQLPAGGQDVNTFPSDFFQAPTTPGYYSLRAVADWNQAVTEKDETNNELSVPYLVDGASPTVSLVSPQPGSILGGVVPVQAFASDDVEVATVTFLLDGARWGEDTVSPFEWVFDTRLLSNGPHTLSVKASDVAGKTATTLEIQIKISNLLVDTTQDGLGTVTSQGENGTKESRLKIFDNMLATKWLDYSNANPTTRASWIAYTYAPGVLNAVSTYTLTSANDAAERDPFNWELQGFSSGTWVTIDSRAGELFPSRYQKRSFAVSHPGSYGGYRLNVLRVKDPAKANSVQLAEMELLALGLGPVNEAPVLAEIGPKTGQVGTWLTFNLKATDGDGDVVKYFAGALPPGATLNAATGAFAWTPAKTGSFSATFVVSDEKGGTDEETIVIQVGGTVLVDTTDDGLGWVSAQGENGVKEGRAKLFDNLVSSKWLDFAQANPATRASWIAYTYAPGVMNAVSTYTLTSANDAAERDPFNWELQGFSSGTWVTIDSRTGELFPSRYQKRSFAVSHPGSYGGYRLNVLRVKDPAKANSVQLAEMELLAPTFKSVTSLSDGPAFGESHPMVPLSSSEIDPVWNEDLIRSQQTLNLVGTGILGLKESNGPLEWIVNLPATSRVKGFAVYQYGETGWQKVAGSESNSGSLRANLEAPGLYAVYGEGLAGTSDSDVLVQIMPNPVRDGRARLRAVIGESDRVTVKVTDVRGGLVRALELKANLTLLGDGTVSYEGEVDFSGLASGVYSCRVEWEKNGAVGRCVKKVVLLK